MAQAELALAGFPKGSGSRLGPFAFVCQVFGVFSSLRLIFVTAILFRFDSTLS
jgi:hypothetical protein